MPRGRKSRAQARAKPEEHRVVALASGLLDSSSKTCRQASAVEVPRSFDEQSHASKSEKTPPASSPDHSPSESALFTSGLFIALSSGQSQQKLRLMPASAFIDAVCKTTGPSHATTVLRIASAGSATRNPSKPTCKDNALSGLEAWTDVPLPFFTQFNDQYLGPQARVLPPEQFSPALISIVYRNDYRAAKELLTHAPAAEFIRKHMFGLQLKGSVASKCFSLDVFTAAIVRKQFDLLELAFAKGVKPSDSSRGILSVAIQHAEPSLRIVRFLIQAGAPIFSSHFSLALQRRNLKLLTLLLRSHSTKQAYDISAPFFLACGNEELLPFAEQFLDQHSKCFTPSNKTTCLIKALENYCLDTATEIIARARSALNPAKLRRFLDYQESAAMKILLRKCIDVSGIGSDMLAAGADFPDQLIGDVRPDEFLALLPGIQEGGRISAIRLNQMMHRVLCSADDIIEGFIEDQTLLDNQLIKLQASHDKLHAEHAICEDRRLQFAENQCAQLKLSFAALQTKHDSQSAKLASVRRAKADIESERDRLRGENSRLEASLFVCEHQRDHFKEALGVAEARLRKETERAYVAVMEKLAALTESSKKDIEVSSLQNQLRLVSAQRDQAQASGASTSSSSTAHMPTCVVCFSEIFAQSRQLAALPCRHFLCSACADRMVARSTDVPPTIRCPICRYECPAGEILKLIDSGLQ